MFYTTVDQVGNALYIRGIDRGVPFIKISNGNDMNLQLFVKTTKDSNITTLFGDKVEPIHFNTIKEMNTFKKQFPNDYYGVVPLANQYITQNNLANANFADIHVGYIDIEVETENEFANPSNPTERINVITLYSSQKGYYTLCLSDVEIPDAICFKTEKDLLNAFLKIWIDLSFNVITNWNGDYFDLPYLYNRIKLVLSEKKANSLSPFGIVHTKYVKNDFGTEEQVTVNIIGISQLDYLVIYKKFVLTPRDNDRLDTIVGIELGDEKLNYSEYDSLKDFYKNNFPKYVLYNKKDVELLIELEKKLKLLQLVFILSYKAKQNLKDILSPIATWDSLCYNYLWERNKVVPPYIHTEKSEQYKGAYVIEPVPGKYNWIATFDVTSLYPSVIRLLNLSPETVVELDNPLSNRNMVTELIEGKISNNVDTHSMSANGQFYNKIPGMMPSLVTGLFKERMDTKRLLALKEKEPIKDDTLKNEIAELNLKQHAIKILLNSLYGAVGSSYFRYFEVKNAEAITLTGQVVSRSIQNAIEQYLTKLLNKGKPSDRPFVIGGDTDSSFICLDELVKQYVSENPDASTKDKVTLIDTFCKTRLSPLIKKVIKSIEIALNGNQDIISMGREYIGSSMIITGKKRYAMLYHDKEGIYFDTPKEKITGIESIKSSTPPACRKLIKETISLMFVADNEAVLKFVEKCKAQLSTVSPDEIAFPKSANGIDKYSSNTSVYKQGTPINTRAAILFNTFIKSRKIKEISPIMEGEKIKYIYLRLPNPLKENVIGWSTAKLPKQLEIIKPYIDYDLMIQKGYFSAIERLFDAIGWNKEIVVDINTMF